MAAFCLEAGLVPRGLGSGWLRAQLPVGSGVCVFPSPRLVCELAGGRVAPRAFDLIQGVSLVCFVWFCFVLKKGD